MNLSRPIVALAASVAAAAIGIVRPLGAQATPPPIIDKHLHALEADAQGPPPMGMCPGAASG